jgi:hypothetical protein
MYLLFLGPSQNYRCLFIVMCTTIWSKNAVYIPILISSNARIMIKNINVFSIGLQILYHLIKYLTLLIFADTWPTYSCIHRNSIYFRLGEKNNSLKGDVEHHLCMHHELMPHFIRQQGERWQTVFCFGFGEGGGENWFKCKRFLLNYPQHLVHRAVQIFKKTCANIFSKCHCVGWHEWCQVKWQSTGHEVMLQYVTMCAWNLLLHPFQSSLDAICHTY